MKRCNGCKKEFEGKGKFCSSNCRVKAHRAKAKPDERGIFLDLSFEAIDRLESRAASKGESLEEYLVRNIEQSLAKPVPKQTGLTAPCKQNVYADPKDCQHPPGRRIGGTCSQCGKVASSQSRSV